MSKKEKKEPEVVYKIDDRVKIIPDEGGPEDFGASGLVLHSNDRRFYPRIKDVMYYMGEIKELPDWCVISTERIKSSSTRDFMVRKFQIRPAKPDEY